MTDHRDWSISQYVKLLVSGPAFDVDDYLASVALPTTAIWHSEDVPPDRRPFCGFEVALGSVEMTEKQLGETARAFLDTHFDSLARLSEHDAPTRLVCLCPELNCRPCVSSRPYEVTAPLAKLAGNLGFCFYVSFRLRCPQNVQNMESWLSHEEYREYVRGFDTGVLRKLADKIDRRKRLIAEAESEGS
jgi:hypothetical protein